MKVSEVKHLVEILVLSGIALIMVFSLKDTWQVYYKGGISVYTLTGVAIRNGVTLLILMGIVAIFG